MKKNILQHIIVIIFSILIYVYLYNEINKKNFNIIFIFYILILVLYKFFNIYSYILSFIIIFFLNINNKEYSIEGIVSFDKIEDEINNKIPEQGPPNPDISQEDHCTVSVASTITNRISDDLAGAPNSPDVESAKETGAKMSEGMGDAVDAMGKLGPGPEPATITM
tara:strand:+ start:550 stop:1047 length:498 start_codon:yes stop_codon:yes gene_type:complete